MSETTALTIIESLPPGVGARDNSSFSSNFPLLQIAWDSTSLGLLKECPRKYYLSNIKGYTPRETSVHLTFGLHYHAALERYDHARAAGADYEEAVRVAVRYALTATWDSTRKRPWMSSDSYKNRLTLIRTVVWYLEQFREDSLITLILEESSKPAVELSFRFETTYNAPDGQHYMLSGHLDRVADFNGDLYISDRKTTKSIPSGDFFSQYSPDNQFTIYSLAGKVVYQLPIIGIIVDAAQVAVTFSRFARGIVTRTESQLSEWYGELHFWLQAAENYALAGQWPMNDKSCKNYGGCPFQPICSKPPQVREQWLSVEFARRQWNPLIARGDI